MSYTRLFDTYMWQAYQQLPQVTLIDCWAHVRRKFFEAVSQNASEKSLAKQGLKYCNRMLLLEKEWELLGNEERWQARQAQPQLLMEKFFDWCKRNESTVLFG